MGQTPEVREFIREIIKVGGLSLRDIDAGEEPFTYSSGNKGPGYVMIKGLVSQRELLMKIIDVLARKVIATQPSIEYVAGNATGGMVPAWELAKKMSELLGREVPYFYVRGSRKKGGHGETITGNTLNPFFRNGRRGIVMEELVNFAETTVNSAEVQREAGYIVEDAACILFYDHEVARERLAEASLRLVHLFTMDELLQEAEMLFPKKLVFDFRDFLDYPPSWMAKRGFKKDEPK